MKLLLGNGNLLIYVDRFSEIKDFYFPMVGQENHIGKQGHKIGVWCDGKLSWLDDSWSIETRYKKDTLVGEIIARNNGMEIELKINNAVHPKNNVYIKKITVKNLKKEKREIRLFLSQYFSIYGTDIGNTAYYYPPKNSIIYYKNKRYFLVSSSPSVSSYAIGKFNFNEMEGTYKDAEDGELGRNAVDHGSVDSTISFHLSLAEESDTTVYYWIATGKHFEEVMELNDFVLIKKPENLIAEAEVYWRNWTNRLDLKIDDDILDMVKRSLLIIRANTDNRGGILASSDSEMLRFSRDTYNYVWMRDAVFAAIALDDAGYSEVSRNFFTFCRNIITNNGFFFQKYNPDGSLGSSWHSWIKDENTVLPIQEDETALVLHALSKHYEKTNDIAFIRNSYREFIMKAADFLVQFREGSNPKESYDLWEEKFGLHTFTACTVYAGLAAAANFASLMKRAYDYNRYMKAAEEIKEAILLNLYDEENDRFLERIENKLNGINRESKIDSSTGYALHEFVFNPKDGTVINEMNTIKEKLTCKTSIGGIARKENDEYFRVSNETPGNPWLICTLWLAQYYIKTAKQSSDLEEAKKILKWVVKHASPTGFLSEQLNPNTGEQLSATPLVWSHACFVETALRYAKKLDALRVGK